jgi:hypothetical protein
MFKARSPKIKINGLNKALDAIFIKFNLTKYFDCINVNMPDTAKLDRVYNWINKDLPESDNLVQWLLLLEYISLVETGNFSFQQCWLMAPPVIKRKLFGYMLRKLYPDIEWIKTVATADSDMFLPIRQQLIRLGGLIFYKADIPFIVDSSVPWPGNTISGAVSFDVSRAIGKSYFLQKDTLNRYSLRANKFGEIGPTLILKSKATQVSYKPETIDRIPTTLLNKEKTEAYTSTFIESDTYLKPFGVNRKGEDVSKLFPEHIETTYIERDTETRKTRPVSLSAIKNQDSVFSGELPTVKLPGNDEQVFLVSGVTQGILGQGGMGRVYKILLKHLEVVRALKILQPSIMGNDPDEWKKFCNRFLREVKILSNLHHTHIAQIHNFGEWQNYPFIEMEYVPGSNLKTLIESSGRLPMEVTTSVAIQVARALSHAHNKSYMLDGKVRKGLIHRDMKPQNVIVSTEGESKLLDFGVALPMGMVTQTMQSNFVGTLQYAAPEQIEGDELDQRIDIYSFGQIIYEMICGKPAFSAPNIQKMLQLKMANAYHDVDSTGLKIPKSLRTIVRTCMELDPENRFRTSEDLLASLEDAHREMTREIPDAVVREYVRGREFASTTNGNFLNTGKPGIFKKLSFWHK